VETPEQIKSRLEAAVPGAKIEVLPNDCPAGERSLLVDPAHVLAVAKFLRDDPQLRLDYCSNVTGVDWPEAEITEKIKVKQIVDGVEKEI
jgi:NADH-quinone oxidoreductase subunit C